MDISLLVSTGHPFSLLHFHVRTQTISWPSKSMPLTHSRVTVTVFQAKALYGHLTWEYAHYGHRIHSRGDHMISSSRYVFIFCWWHWRTLYFMCAPYFFDDTYGHCIWSEGTIWSLDFRIRSSRSPYTFCGAKQPVVGWLRGQWFP